MSTTPAAAWDHAEIAAAAGADLFLVQSQVSSARHISTSGRVLSLSDLTGALHLPVLVGNTVSGEAAYQLMQQGAAAILVGVGPGAACTTREVLGIGVPQVSATLEVAAARDKFMADTGRYVPVVTDGGMKTGGDIAKAIASGADAVMLGSPFAGALEAPGPWLQLGHGRALADPAARHAHHDRGASCRWSRSCSARPPRPTAPRTWSAPCASRWPPWAPARSTRCIGWRW